MAETQRTFFDVSDFQKEVIEQSHTTPVVVDFWAAWCAPCRILSPILERLAEQANGTWVLAKVNTEEHIEVARQFRIASIPTVKLFVNGKVSSEFVGALPDYAVKQWLEKNLPSKYVKQIEIAKALLEQGNTAVAQTLLRQIIETDANVIEARVLLATTVLLSNPSEALALVQHIDEPEFSQQVDSIKTIARLLQLTPDTLSEKPVKTIYLEAIEHLKNFQFDKSLEKFIAVIREDRYYDDDGARKACIAIFKYLGEENEITQKYRREFSSALYV